jgi:copper chaperone CopZ
MRRKARTFRAGGMRTAGSAGKVGAALDEVRGAVRVAVSLEPGLARVDFYGDRASPEATAGAITGLGHQVNTQCQGGSPDRAQRLRQSDLRRRQIAAGSSDHAGHAVAH